MVPRVNKLYPFASLIAFLILRLEWISTYIICIGAAWILVVVIRLSEARNFRVLIYVAIVVLKVKSYFGL